MPTRTVILDDAFDVDPFILADMPFNAYYPLEIVTPVPPVPPKPGRFTGGGGVGFRKAPMWPASVATGRATIWASAARVKGLADAVDELGGDDSEALDLL